MNWQTKKLGDICEIQIGKTPRREVGKYWGGNWPWVKISELDGRVIKDSEEKITDIAILEQGCKKIPKGTILFSFKLSIGKLAITGVDLYTNEAIAAFIVRDTHTLDTKYLFYYLPLVRYDRFLSGATKGKTLNSKTLPLLPVVLPPIDIQKQIVEKLDSIRKLQELNNYQTSKTNEIHESLINEEIKSNKHTMVKLLEVTRPQEFINPKKSPNDEYQYVDISSIDSENLSVDLNSVKQFKGKDAPSRARKKIEEGDILFSTVRPNLKRIAIVNFSTFNSLASTGFAVLRPDGNKVNPNYMGTITCSGIVTDQVLPQVRGATYPAVSDNDVFNAKIPLPERKKQDEIAEEFTAVQEYKKNLIKQRELFKELFESMLDKAMKGKLVN